MEHAKVGRFVTAQQQIIAAKVAEETSAAGGKLIVPFEFWNCESVAAPGAAQDGFGWWLIRRKLKRFMESGGILILLGATRTGKTVLIQRVMPSSVIQNFLPSFESSARIQLADIPDGIFAIDETTYHSRQDVLTAIDKAISNRKGFCLTFQSASQFRDYDVAAYIANQKVLVFELSR